MKTKSLIIALMLAVASATLLSSCATKQRALSRLENFSEDLSTRSDFYTVDEWKDAAEKFVKIRKDISKHEMEYTAEEKARIGKLEGKCAGYLAKGAKDGIFDKIKGVGNEINGILKGILNVFTE